MKRKMNWCAFLGSLRLQPSSFHSGKILFFHQAPIPRFTKTCFPAVSELCKDTRKTQCTIPWEWQKRLGESILWVLTAIPVIPIRWNCSERWLSRKKCLADCFIQKIPKLDQSCCFNEKTNETVFFLMQILGYNYPDSTFGKYCF